MKNKIAIYASDSIKENQEIIKILESLGGENRFLDGHTTKHSCYYIREDNLIECSNINYCYNRLIGYKVYTLKEYKKEFMENKEMKIIPPEGYEIDKENSSFEKIVFKKIEEKLTYEKIISKLFAYKPNYYIAGDGNIGKSFTGWECPNTAQTEYQLKRLLAINKLMNVAYYLNDGWEPNWENPSESKYSLAYDPFDHKIAALIFGLNYVFVYFKTKELAEQALKILGEETIKLALGVL